MVTSLTSLNVSWEQPSLANGVISFYEVSYYQDTDVNGKISVYSIDISIYDHFICLTVVWVLDRILYHDAQYRKTWIWS